LPGEFVDLRKVNYPDVVEIEAELVVCTFLQDYVCHQRCTYLNR
jgi:hypothetical protein